MMRRISVLLILSVLLTALLALPAFAAKAPKAQKSTFNVLDISRNAAMGDGYGKRDVDVSRRTASRALGASAYSTAPNAFVGVKVGETMYEFQHNGTVGRMVEWGPWGADAISPESDPMVHFAWMWMPEDMSFRSLGYNYYNGGPGMGTLLSPFLIVSPDRRVGYVNIDVTSDNRAHPGGHAGMTKATTNYMTEIWHQEYPYLEEFYCSSRIPVDVACWGYNPSYNQAMWPKYAIQYGPTDTVLHVIAQIWIDGYRSPLYYYRKIGYDCEYDEDDDYLGWVYPPYPIDTIQVWSPDLAIDRDGTRLAVVWGANLPLPGDPCDTCSYNDTDDQWNQNVYYQISDDMGVNWHPRVNLTQFVDGVEGWRMYCDMSALMDSDNNLHILYPIAQVPANLDDGGYWTTKACRLIHWSENVPYQRVVHDQLYDTDDYLCGPGFFSLPIAKVALSECDGKLYALWSQHNAVDKGIFDDCAARYPDDPFGASNGDLHVGISSDDGMTWDNARNLTNTFSGGCGPETFPCASEMWPSMARFGRENLPGEEWSSAVVLDADPVGYDGDYFLDVMYVADVDAGSSINDEGEYAMADMNWVRLACVDPLPSPKLTILPSVIADPAWTKPGIQLDTVLTLENNGNVPNTYSVTLQQFSGPANWLNLSGAMGTDVVLPSGLNNTETRTLSMNLSGVINTQLVVTGQLTFVSDAPNSPLIVPISLIVCDTLHPALVDTIFTTCLALQVSNTGNSGGGKYNVSMDYNPPAPLTPTDCSENADMYIYEGSPILGWYDDVADSAVMFWSMMNQNWLTSNGFRPVGGHLETYECDPEFTVFHSGTFLTMDSTVALSKLWIASTDPENCTWIIQYLKVWSYDGEAHPGLVIGEGVDWDVPSDSEVFNTGDFIAASGLVYQRGYEYVNEEDECQNNDDRYGGLAFIESFVDDVSRQTVLYGAYVGENDALIFDHNNDFLANELYANMGVSGYTITDSTEDLHMVMTYEHDLDLGATETYGVFTVLTTVMDGDDDDLVAQVTAAKNWYNTVSKRKDLKALLSDTDGDGIINICDNLPTIWNPYQTPDTDGDGIADEADNCPDVANPGQEDADLNGIGDACEGPLPCCIGIAGNANCDALDKVNSLDILYLVNYLYKSGPFPCCMVEANANCDVLGKVNSLDILYLVNYLYKSGPAPCTCP